MTVFGRGMKGHSTQGSKHSAAHVFSSVNKLTANAQREYFASFYAQIKKKNSRETNVVNTGCYSDFSRRPRDSF